MCLIHIILFLNYFISEYNPPFSDLPIKADYSFKLQDPQPDI